MDAYTGRLAGLLIGGAYAAGAGSFAIAMMYAVLLFAARYDSLRRRRGSAHTQATS